MSDLISKEVVIDTLNAVRDLVWDVDIPSPTVPAYIEHHKQMQSIMRNIDILTDKIIKMPSAQQWIPCNERLPETDGRYLVTCSKIGAWVVDWNIWHNEPKPSWLWEQGVTAWMPLPEPYEMGVEHDS